LEGSAHSHSHSHSANSIAPIQSQCFSFVALFSFISLWRHLLLLLSSVAHSLPRSSKGEQCSACLFLMDSAFVCVQSSRTNRISLIKSQSLAELSHKADSCLPACLLGFQLTGAQHSANSITF